MRLTTRLVCLPGVRPQLCRLNIEERALTLPPATALHLQPRSAPSRAVQATAKIGWIPKVTMGSRASPGPILWARAMAIDQILLIADNRRNSRSSQDAHPRSSRDRSLHGTIIQHGKHKKTKVRNINCKLRLPASSGLGGKTRS